MAKKHLDKVLPGYNEITNERAKSGIAMGLIYLPKSTGPWRDVTTDKETCFLLLHGQGEFRTWKNDFKKHNKYLVSRNSLFDESPYCLLIPRETEFEIIPQTDMEAISIQVKNNKTYAPRFFTPNDIAVERRGQDLLLNRSERLVKTVFDYSTMPDSNLVVGEVVAFPGNWSSYPDHSHPQPEIYFYRLQPENGYGICKLGEDKALVVRHNDAVEILDNAVHPQSTPPGFVMWYLWVVRHLPGNPYTGFKFDSRYEWLNERDAKIWQPPKN